MSKEEYRSSNIIEDAKIQFNDIEFNKNFRVFSNNFEESKKIIAVNLMNFLLELKKKSPEGVSFSLSGQKFNIGLNNSKNLFKLDIKNQINEQNLKIYYDEIFSCLEIVVNIFSCIEQNLSFNNNL